MAGTLKYLGKNSSDDYAINAFVLNMERETSFGFGAIGLIIVVVALIVSVRKLN